MEKDVGNDRILTTIRALKDAATKAEEECSKSLENTAATIKSLKYENQSLRYDLHRATNEFEQKEKGFQDALKTERDAFTDMRTRLLKRQKELEQTLQYIKDETKQNTKEHDLSDDLRPTKVAERYLELYDNKWADAYEEIEKDFKTEEKPTQELLRILKKIMEFCTDVAQQQDVNVHNALLINNKETDYGLLKDASKQLSSCKKRLFSETCEDIFKLYISKLQQSSSSDCRRELRIATFVKECICVCWMCLIQFPPLKIEFDVKAHGKEFKKDIYKPFTKSGTKIDFIVWPALRLYKDGPVLVTGIAQGLEESRSRRFHFMEHKRTYSPDLSGLTRSKSSSNLATSPLPEKKKGFGQWFQKLQPQRQSRGKSFGSLFS